MRIWRISLVTVVVSVFTLALAIANAAPGDPIALEFDDGNLPSAPGWQYSSNCGANPSFPRGVDLPEATALNVSSGILNLNKRLMLNHVALGESR